MSKEDYSNFSWESIEKSLRDIFAEVKAQTGATDEELNAALSESAIKIMNTNMLREPAAPETLYCHEPTCSKLTGLCPCPTALKRTAEATLGEPRRSDVREKFEVWFAEERKTGWPTREAIFEAGYQAAVEDAAQCVRAALGKETKSE